MPPIRESGSTTRTAHGTSRVRRRSRRASPSAGHAHAAPTLVLDALRAEADPATSKRLPTILKLAAHLQLVGECVSRSAAILVSAFEDLPPDTAVNPEQRRALYRLAARDNARLMELSIAMREESLLAALRKAPHNTRPVEALLDQYFPIVTSVDDARAGHNQLYVRAMTEEDIGVLAEARAAVVAAIEDARRGVAPERGPTLAELGDEMVDAAEDVVADADELEAMFPRLSKRSRVGIALCWRAGE